MQTNPAQSLRNVLRFDALTCLLSGVASIGLAQIVAAPLGLSVALLQGSGAALLPIAAFIAFASKNVSLRWPIWIVVIGNAAWVLDSVLVVVGGFEHPTTLGAAYVIAQAVVVAVLAELELTGLRKTAVPAPVAAHN